MLYVGTLGAGGTCAQRLSVLRELGHEVAAFDVDTYLARSSRLVNSLRLRLSWGPGVDLLNEDLVRNAKSQGPELVWIDKGIFVRAKSLEAIRKFTGATLVHYNPDDPFGSYRRGWRVFLQALPSYDLHLVPRDANKAEYLRAGARHVIRFRWAFDPQTHRPVPVTDEDRARLGGPVGFIGDWETERAASLRFLADRGVPVRVWGTNWNKCRPVPMSMKLEGRPLLGRDYSLGISTFDINLGFLRKGNRDLSTTRSVEIPASGGFLLAERTDEHLAMFDEGVEAEFFEGDDELLDKVRDYLARPEDRRRIAEAGRRRCLESGYSNHHELSRILDQIEALGLRGGAKSRSKSLVS